MGWAGGPAPSDPPGPFPGRLAFRGTEPSCALQEMSELQTTEPDALMREALAASQQNDSETALALFARVSEMSPSAAAPHLLAAGELAHTGRYAEAEAAYARALLLDPALHIGRFQLGLLQYTSQKVPMAMLTWQPLLELGRAHPLALFVQGFASLAQDRLSDAVGFFHAGMRANTENAPLNADIAMLLQRLADATAASEGARAPAAEAAEATNAPTDTEGRAHVLLSNYQQGGPIH